MTDIAALTEELAGAPPAVPPALRTALRQLARRPAALAGLIGILVIAAVAVFAPFVAPHDPLEQDLSNTLAPPVWDGGGADHVLGTDSLGRDVASRLIFGARNSLLIGAGGMLIGALLGLTVGLVAGFFRGRLETVLMRLGDVQLAFPFILLAIAVLGTVANRSTWHIVVVLGVPGWIVYARVVRSRVLAEREKDYVTAARALGASKLRTLVRYVLPSSWQVVPVIALLDVGFLIIVESTLSFLGFGLTPPTPSWGAMLADGRQNMVVSTWLPVVPGIAIMLTVLSINLLADGIADVLDPKLTKGAFHGHLLRLVPRWGGRAEDVGRGGHAGARVDDAAPAMVEHSDDGERPLLQVRDLAVQFPQRDQIVTAVRNVAFDLAPGETLGIVGESGSGKSVTALSIIQLLDPPGRVTSGHVVLDGIDVTRLAEREMAKRLRGRRVGMIFQNPASSLNPVLSIGFQMIETIRHHGRMSRREAAEVARRALGAVGIGDPDRVLRQYPFQLSGGMNQRVMIAMAMSSHPDLLLADEPTTALDVTTQAQILEQLQEITRRLGTSLVLITHDIALVARYADTILVMYGGQVCELGPANEVIDRPKHPYTVALLEAVPRADLPIGERLEAIGGEPPDPAAIPRGCPFAPRCPSVMDHCREINPALTEVGLDVGRKHTAACHLWSPAGGNVEAVPH
jgi:peptide/nickel transport system permease protein